MSLDFMDSNFANQIMQNQLSFVLRFNTDYYLNRQIEMFIVEVYPLVAFESNLRYQSPNLGS